MIVYIIVVSKAAATNLTGKPCSTMLRPTCWPEDAVKKKAIRTWSALISCSASVDWNTATTNTDVPARSKQTASGTQYYHYDAEHRLTEVRIEQLNHTERYGYVYDALGRRIEKHRLDRDGKPCNRTTFLWNKMQNDSGKQCNKRQSLVGKQWWFWTIRSCFYETI